jgi:hypothetical protein
MAYSFLSPGSGALGFEPAHPIRQLCQTASFQPLGARIALISTLFIFAGAMATVGS